MARHGKARLGKDLQHNGPPWPRPSRSGLGSSAGGASAYWFPQHHRRSLGTETFPDRSNDNHSRDRHGGRSTRPEWDGLWDRSKRGAIEHDIGHCKRTSQRAQQL